MSTKRRTKTVLPYFILNPAASAGRLGRNQAVLLRSLEKHFPGGFTLDVTTRPGHATEITRQVLRMGAKLVVAIGGDGTINEVVNGFFDRRNPVGRDARVGFLCVGTAKDVGRNLALPDNLDAQMEILRSGVRRKIDLGRVTCHTDDGGRAERFFMNDCQAGIAATIVKRVTPGLKRLGGFLAFGIGSTLTALTYRAKTMSVSVNGRPWVSGKFLGVTAANGRYAGGGMDFAPSSRIDDGSLDLLIIKDQSVPARLVNFPKIYSGAHIDLSWVLLRSARKIVVASPQRVGIEADGELIGFLPCEITVVPRIISIASPRVAQK